MSEEIEDTSNEDFAEIQDDEQPDAAQQELVLLKERADTMGIKYHPQIGVKKLKAKIEDRKKDVANEKRRAAAAVKKASTQMASPAQAPVNTPSMAAQLQQYDEAVNNIPSRTVAKHSPVTSESARRMIIRKKANKLVRIRITCMNPNKSKLPGEIFSVGNAAIGFLKKFVPFNAENGWHVPQIILTQIQNRKFTTFYEVEIGGKKQKRSRQIPEFAVEIMKPLTGQELKELAQRQRMASGKADE